MTCNTIIKKELRFLLHLGLVISFLSSCTSNEAAESASYLNRPFVIDPNAENKTEDSFHSPKLDSLLQTTNGFYFLPDISGTSFENYHVTVVSCQNLEKQLLLFYDKKDILKDTLLIPYDEVFSLEAVVSKNKKGVCIGTYNEEFNYLKIKSLYILDNSVKLHKTHQKQLLVQCFLPQAYLTEENPVLEETFSFGFDDPKKPVQLTIGEWKPNCDSMERTLIVFKDKIEFDIVVDEVAVLGMKLDMKPVFGNGEILLYFTDIAYFWWPMGQEYTYPHADLSAEDISRDVPVGKLIPVNENQFELVWYGLHHTSTKSMLFKDGIHYEKDRKGKVMMNFCSDEN